MRTEEGFLNEVARRTTDRKKKSDQMSSYSIKPFNDTLSFGDTQIKLTDISKRLSRLDQSSITSLSRLTTQKQKQVSIQLH